MGNCLVTKLKGVVDNSGLLKIGEVGMNILPTEGAMLFRWEADAMYNCTARIVSGQGYFNVDGSSEQLQEVPLDRDKILYVTAQTELFVVITNYYKLHRCMITSAVIMKDINSFFKYATNLAYITVDGHNIDLDIIKSNTIGQVTLNIGVSGQLNSLLEKFDLAYPYKVIDISGSSITGTIESICDYYGDGINLIAGHSNPNFTGSIEGFVAGMRIKHPSVNSIPGVIIGGNITFNGEVTEIINSPLSWTSNTITYNGVTINA